MEDWIGGSPYDTKDERPIVRKKMNEVIHNSLHSDMNEFINPNILKFMNKSARALKKTNLIETRSKIEYDKYNTTEYPAFLWQEKYVASFYFFAIVLGYIDKKIDIEKNNIEFNSKFLVTDTKSEHTHKDEIDNSNRKIKIYSLDRKEVLYGYKTIMDEKNSKSHIILEILENYPSYDKFYNLYKDHKEWGTQLYLNQQLINAYNLGYMFNKEEYHKIISKYRKLYNELFVEKQHNDAFVTIKTKEEKINEKRKRK